jgi:hypothetical protein
VDHARTTWQVSIRRACRALPVERSTYHYRSRRAGQAHLSERIRRSPPPESATATVVSMCYCVGKGGASTRSGSIGCTARWACNCGIRRCIVESTLAGCLRKWDHLSAPGPSVPIYIRSDDRKCLCHARYLRLTLVSFGSSGRRQLPSSRNDGKRGFGRKSQKGGDCRSCVLGAELEHAEIMRRSSRKELDYFRCVLRIHAQELLVIHF